MPPGMALAALLWGDANQPNALLFQPLPLLAVYPLLLLMPVTQGLARSCRCTGATWRRACAPSGTAAGR